MRARGWMCHQTPNTRVLQVEGRHTAGARRGGTRGAARHGRPLKFTCCLISRHSTGHSFSTSALSFFSASISAAFSSSSERGLATHLRIHEEQRRVRRQQG